jgi:hypothetical protein
LSSFIPAFTKNRQRKTNYILLKQSKNKSENIQVLPDLTLGVALARRLRELRLERLLVIVLKLSFCKKGVFNCLGFNR